MATAIVTRLQLKVTVCVRGSRLSVRQNPIQIKTRIPGLWAEFRARHPAFLLHALITRVQGLQRTVTEYDPR